VTVILAVSSAFFEMTKVESRWREGEKETVDLRSHPECKGQGETEAKWRPVVLIGQRAGRTIRRARRSTLDEVTLPSRRCPTSTLYIPLKMLRRISPEAEW